MEFTPKVCEVWQGLIPVDMCAQETIPAPQGFKQWVLYFDKLLQFEG